LAEIIKVVAEVALHLARTEVSTALGKQTRTSHLKATA
jgi:hypothetical protein